jgi:hypothetical protein
METVVLTVLVLLLIAGLPVVRVYRRGFIGYGNPPARLQSALDSLRLDRNLR